MGRRPLRAAVLRRNQRKGPSTCPASTHRSGPTAAYSVRTPGEPTPAQDNRWRPTEPATRSGQISSAWVIFILQGICTANSRFYSERCTPGLELTCAPVAQLDRARVFGTRGCRFNSCRAHHICRRPSSRSRHPCMRVTHRCRGCGWWRRRDRSPACRRRCGC